MKSSSVVSTWRRTGLISALCLAALSGCNSRDEVLGVRGNVTPLAPPTVTAVMPANNATAVPIRETVITAEFSEPVVALAAADFTVTCEAPCTEANGVVSMNAEGTVATFMLSTPAALEPQTQYTATIVRATSRATGQMLQTPFVWRFTTEAAPDTARPRVTLTEPATSDPGPTTGVPIDTALRAVFSEDMDPATITDANFTLSCALPCVAPAGAVSYVDATRSLAFTPEDALQGGATYTATVSSAVTDLAGNELAGNQGPETEASDYVWRFTTAPPPTVTAVAPVNEATGVPINETVITAQFSEPVDALAAGDFTVSCEAPCTSANGVVSMNADRTITTFTVTDADGLEPLTPYTATIVRATSSATGQRLQAPFVWRFTTGVAADTTRPRVTLTEPPTSDPGPSTGVPTNTAITAVFSEDMDPGTVIDANFTLNCELPCEAPTGSVSYVVGSRSLVFSPDAQLDADTTYTATIAQAVTDLAGNDLAGNQGPVTEASDYVWRFTTAVAVPANNLAVTSTDPINGGTLAVCPNASINATFDVPSGLRLDPQTVSSLTFRVVEDATPTNTVIAESVVIDVDTGRIATFTPQDELTEGLTYRATLQAGPDGVKDLAVPGNELLEDVVWTFTVVAAVESCLEPIPLNSAAPFGIFGGSAGMTNDGLLTVINGDIGTTALSTSVTGFVSASGCEYIVTGANRGVVNGRIFTAPPQPTTPPPPDPACAEDGTAETQAIAQRARMDASDAFIALSPAALPGGANPGNDNLGGLTLLPGVYTAPSDFFLIQGDDLTLDGGGNQNAVWVFQMGSFLTVGEAAIPRSVILINGAQAKNVFWQVGSAATINPSGGGTMKGTIIAEAGISTSTTGNNAPELIVTIDGRALSLTASVTVTNTIINVPAP